jgi:tetratricopeptide (TPR) repeat protein
MQMVVSLLGKARIEGGAENLTRNPLFLYLAIHHPQPVRRDVLIADLWPEETPADVGNRFRVALTRLRRQVPLMEHDGMLALDPIEVQVDRASLATRIERAMEEPDPALEERLLTESLDDLSQPLLPEIDEPWLAPSQAEWGLRSSAAIQRVVEVARKKGDPELAVRAARAGLRILPFDESFWTSFLKAMAELGQVSEAQRSFVQARTRYRDEGEDFSPKLVELAQNLAKWSVGTELGRIPEDQAAAMVRFVSRCLETDAPLAVQMLGSPAFRPEVLHDPVATLPLLERVLTQSHPPSEALERVEVRRITALALMDRDAEVIAACDRFLAKEIGPARRRIALLNLAPNLFRQGRIEEAFAAIDCAIDIAEATDTPVDAWQCRAQRGNLMVLNEEAEAALPLLEQANAYLRSVGRTDHDDGICLAFQAQALAHTGRHQEAIPLCRQTRQTAQVKHHLDVETLASENLGWSLAVLGDEEGARSALRGALRAAYRHGVRYTVDALGYAAESLQLLADRHASIVIRDWLLWASATKPVLSPMERTRLTRIGHSSSEVKGERLPLADTARRAVAILRGEA